MIEVSDEVAEALLLMRREENNRTRKIWYHKAYYSLDCEDGIENCAFDFTAKSPEEILLEQEEEQLFLATPRKCDREKFPSLVSPKSVNRRVCIRKIF